MRIAALCLGVLFLSGIPGRGSAIEPWLDVNGRVPRRSVSMDYLYEACSSKGNTAGGDIAYFDCESYVYGVLDTYLNIKEALPLNEQACFPKDLPPWRALELAEPLGLGAAGRKDAAPQIIVALRRRYPCPGAVKVKK